jgi:hypothetical protein
MALFREQSESALAKERAKLSNRRMHATVLHDSAPSILAGPLPVYYPVEPTTYNFLMSHR